MKINCILYIILFLVSFELNSNQNLIKPNDNIYKMKIRVIDTNIILLGNSQVLEDTSNEYCYESIQAINQFKDTIYIMYYKNKLYDNLERSKIKINKIYQIDLW
ncbi:MAG: hypothetical protein NTW25_06470 [Candidatus Kapabacteria bacterium]|nr:hypothetical protein [Candidatus Kapabacteria bacterium]